MSTNAQSCEVLTQKKCQPCEGGVPKMTAEEVAEQMKEHPGWEVTHQGERIARNWTVKNFMAGMEFFHQVAEIAESEGHHPRFAHCGISPCDHRNLDACDRGIVRK